MNTEKQIQVLQEQIARTNAALAELSSQFFKNNFTSTQTFNKDSIFSSRLRVPVFSGAPTVGEIGDLICVAAKLYVCTSTNPVVFTLVGSQT